mmetsp:Transcript_9507/g.41092  ORF Transcript_9507/g.41092 Transcript_9507/m.41092 type:complete len:93 (-) Transcript_9507:191-469(-)
MAMMKLTREANFDQRRERISTAFRINRHRTSFFPFLFYSFRPSEKNALLHKFPVAEPVRFLSKLPTIQKKKTWKGIRSSEMTSTGPRKPEGS